jgi:hypothetical protein
MARGYDVHDEEDVGADRASRDEVAQPLRASTYS